MTSVFVGELWLPAVLYALLWFQHMVAPPPHLNVLGVPLQLKSMLDYTLKF